jgi:SAM-dependent methyltransferase
MRRQDWDQRYAGAELVCGAAPNRFLAAEVDGLTAGRALDLGCGEGRNAIWLAERGWQVTGVDFSQVGLDKARRQAAGRGVEISLVHADLLDYQPAGGAYDLVVVLYLQLPAVQRREVLGRAVAALAPGGTLLVIGHDRLNLTEGHGGPRDPEVLFTPADIEHELPGLRIERAERVLRLLTVDGREVDAIDALVRARRPAGAPARSSVGQEPMAKAT